MRSDGGEVSNAKEGLIFKGTSKARGRWCNEPPGCGSKALEPRGRQASERVEISTRATGKSLGRRSRRRRGGLLCRRGRRDGKGKVAGRAMVVET